MSFFPEGNMKPIIILPPDTMEPDAIQELRDNGLCVVVAKEPSRVKFLDPIPAVAGRTAVEQAAVLLSRKILNQGFWTSESTRKEVATAYVDILVKGTRLDPKGTPDENYEAIFNEEKAEEFRRLAREEARALRKAQKTPKTAGKP